MTIVEMQAWLERVEPGVENCALRQSFENAISDPFNRAMLERAIIPLKPTEFTEYVLNVGHLLALIDLNLRIEREFAIEEADGAAPKKPVAN